jgi:small-conductance mechanosensitive channel
VVTLDSSAAWQTARRIVSANRDVLLAIAGVFFLMPQLVNALLPMPQVMPGMTPEQIGETFTGFYTSRPLLFPVLLLLTLPGLVGHLTMLTVLLDRDRPTVGGAIRTGFQFLPSYLAVQFLIALALFVMLVLVTGVLSLLFIPPAIASAIAIVGAIYPLLRLVMVGPEMIVRKVPNPFRAIGFGLGRTRGHFTSLLLFFMPAVAIFVVIFGLVLIFVNPLLALVVHGESLRLISEAIAAVLTAIGQTYYAAIVASTYNQLGPVGGLGDAISPSNPS